MPQPQGRTGGRETPADVDLEMFETSSVVATIVLAGDGRIRSANALMRGLLGLGEGTLGYSRHVTEFVAADAWALLCDAGVTLRPVELILRASNGAEHVVRGDVWASGEGSARRISAMLVDGAESKALRAVAQHSARMEALGSLTAGIAHDFNNLLTVLVGNLYLLGEELRDRPRAFEKLKAARDAGKRGADLIKQLMTFARRETLEIGTVDPAKVVENIVPLLRRALGARITLETSFRDARGSVRASAAQLESAVVNLAVNARDAIEGKGRVGIDVRARDVTPAEAALVGLPAAGRYVAVSVRDTGAGIPADSLARVFEPFYSTKRDRGGTGLGLSMVRWFAEQSAGVATIDSVVGQGTVVTLLLPRQADEVQDALDRTMPLSTLPTGDERVVVLAMDEALRATIHQTLEVLGYRVRVAAGARDLLEIMTAEQPQLLLVDGLWAGDSEMLARARAAVPSLRILATLDAARTSERAPIVGPIALHKPFSLAELAGAVRRSIDSAAS
jgi:signal transduction histidine kinase